MTLDKAIFLQDRATNAIISVFNDGERHSLTHDIMLERLNERLHSIRRESLPRWLASAIQAQISVMFRAQYSGVNPKVVWRHCFEGALYAEWNDLPEAGKQLARENKLVSGHYWSATGLPFSVTSTDK